MKEIQLKNNERWEIAQKYEIDFWLENQEKIYNRDDSKRHFYDEYASAILSWIAPVISLVKPFKRILEIGSGPLGVCGFIKAEEIHSIDSLEHVYRSRSGFTRFRNRTVKYADGKAENLPYENGYFDLVIMINSIDHTRSPGDVLSEISRVTSGSGYVYISLHVHTAFAVVVRRVLENSMKLDKGHPHVFHESDVKRLLHEHRFVTVKEDSENYFKACKKIFLEKYLRRKAYALLGLAGMNLQVLCSKVR